MMKFDLSFGRTMIAASLLISATAAQAAPAARPSATALNSNLFAYSVFAKHDITSTHSDYQGLTGAGGDVQLSSFYIRTGLAAGGDVRVVNSAVEGYVVGRSVHLDHAGASQTHSNTGFVAVASSLSTQMDQLSARLAQMTPTTQATEQGRTLTVQANGLTVVDISATDLTAGENLVINGSSSSTLIINVTGNTAFISQVGIFLSGGIGANNILFNFPTATDIVIESSGSPLINGVNVGIPGTVLAPNANVHFAKDLITGGLFVSSLDGVVSDDVNHVYPGGQINQGCFNGAAVNTGCGGPVVPPPTPIPAD